VQGRCDSGPPKVTSVNSGLELALFIPALLLGVIAFKRMTFWLIVIVLEQWLARTNRK
jgi:hypothetical protein